MTSHPLLKSGRQDSNLRPPGPKPGALTGLRHAPNLKNWKALRTSSKSGRKFKFFHRINVIYFIFFRLADQELIPQTFSGHLG